jgi:glycosyltransferase involved in cell wall biosynthesis
MRRSILFHHDSHGFGGMELYLFRLIGHLDPDRFTCALLVPGFRSENRSSPDEVVDEARARGIPVLRPPDPGSTPGLGSARELAATVGILRRHRPDVVHIHTCRPTGARRVTVAARLAGVPGLVRSEHFPPGVTATATDWWRVRPFDWATDRIVTGSDGDRADQLSLLRRPSDKVVRLHNSIPLDGLDPDHDVCAAKVRLGLDPGVPVITNVGRLVEQKGQRHLIEALPRVIERCGPVNAVIVGDGPLHGALDGLARRLGVADAVHLVGFQDDVTPYLRAADVASMPSLFEVFSLAMLEMMALGKPVVASDHSSFTEAITHEREGLIVPREDSGALADALVRLLGDPRLRQSLGAAAAARVRAQFGIERLAGEVMDLYDQVSARRACAG